jgi:CheY-like chemotaxis protein
MKKGRSAELAAGQKALNRLLIVDDDKQYGEAIVTAARKRGIDARLASGRVEFEALYQSFEPNMLVLDLFLQQEDCYPILAYLSVKRCTAPIFFLSGFNRHWLGAASELARSCGLLVADVFEKQRDGISALMFKLESYKIREPALR